MKLNVHEQAIYDVLVQAGKDTDVAIDALYKVAYSAPAPTQNQLAQQRLGADISRLNRKLEDTRVRPGMLKRTYRLTAHPPA